MRKRREDGRFVRGSDTGNGTVRVEVDRSEATRPGREREGAPRPKFCRTYTRSRVAEALPEIVETFVKRAKAGSVAHAKALASLGGLDKGDVVPQVAKRRGKSVAQRLLEDVGEEPQG